MTAIEDLVRANVSQFHRNFSAGDFEQNGPLVTADVEVMSNGVEVHGREAFIERIRRYEGPFPGLQLLDRIIIVDGQTAAVLFLLQGVHGGPFAGLDATGNLVEAFSGEIFDCTDEGLLAKLLTITRIDLIAAQTHGIQTLPEHQSIEPQPTRPVDEEEADSIIQVATSLYVADAQQRQVSAQHVIAPDALVIADGATRDGAGPWLSQWEGWQAALADLTVTVDRVLQDGNRAAVIYTVRGTHEGIYRHAVKGMSEASGAAIEFRGVDFLEFDGPQRIVEIASVHNPDMIYDQLQ